MSIEDLVIKVGIIPICCKCEIDGKYNIRLNETWYDITNEPETRDFYDKHYDKSHTYCDTCFEIVNKELDDYKVRK